MKTLKFALVLLVVLVFVGCGRKDVPVVVVQEAPVVAEAPKELTLAEKQIRAEAKQKAEKFYRVLGDFQKKNQYPAIVRLEENIKTLKISSDFSLWRTDDLKQIMTRVDDSKRFVFDVLTQANSDYEYLLNVMPDLVREKTEVEQNKMRQELNDLRIFYQNKYAEAEAYFPTINLELKGRHTD